MYAALAILIIIGAAALIMLGFAVAFVYATNPRGRKETTVAMIIATALAVGGWIGGNVASDRLPHEATVQECTVASVKVAGGKRPSYHIDTTECGVVTLASRDVRGKYLPNIGVTYEFKTRTSPLGVASTEFEPR